MGTLTRYFLDNLFGRQLLDEDGIMALRRVVITAFAGVLSVALYLPRMLHKKYADLAALTDPEPYRQALVADSMLLICMTVMLAALAAPLVAPFDPLEQDIGQRLREPGWQDAQGRVHPLGTDHLGRDIFSRIIFGSRIALLVGLAAVVISGVLGPSLQNIIIVIGVSSWVVYARVVRGEVLSIRERDFVQAAIALGSRDVRVLLRHILPNALTPWLVVATLDMARVILTESALSFLGLGVQPPTPTWGGMLADGRVYLSTAWWLATFPGLAILVTVLGINLFGDGLRDTLDPRLKV